MKNKAVALIQMAAAFALAVAVTPFPASAAWPWDDKAKEIKEEIENKISKCKELKQYVNVAPQGEERLTDVPGCSSELPAIAYDDVHKEFGIVWQRWDINYQVYFTRVGVDGAKLCGDILVSDGLYDGREPSVAWNPVKKCYLVSWSDARDCYLEKFYGDGGGYPMETPGIGEVVIPDVDVPAFALHGKFIYIPETRLLALEGVFFSKYIFMKVAGDDGSGLPVLAKDAYSGLLYTVPDGYTRINFGYHDQSGEVWYDPAQSQDVLEAYGAQWTGSWYRLLQIAAQSAGAKRNSRGSGEAGRPGPANPRDDGGRGGGRGGRGSGMNGEGTKSPCNPFVHPPDYQIYVRTVTPLTVAGPGGYKVVLGDPLRITEPDITWLARKSSLVWHQGKGKFGLAWLETRKDGQSYNDYLYFNELSAAPFIPVSKAFPQNKKASPLMSAPDNPCLAVNDDYYVCAYQRKDPGFPSNIYFRPIYAVDFIEGEIPVSSATDNSNGAIRPKLIRTHSEMNTVVDEEGMSWPLTIGEDWLVVTWEQEGKQYLARFDPAIPIIKDGYTGDVAVFAGEGGFVTPAVGCHAAGLAALTHEYNQETGSGDLTLTVLDFAGAQKMSAELDCFPEGTGKARIDDGEGMSFFPAAAWSGGNAGGVYGVVWQDGRHGPSEIYFCPVSVEDALKVWVNPEIDNGCDYGGCSCGEIFEKYCEGEEPPGSNPPPILPDMPAIAVKIIEDPVTKPGLIPGVDDAYFLVYHVVAYSAESSFLDQIQVSVDGVMLDPKIWLQYKKEAIKVKKTIPPYVLKPCDPSSPVCNFPWVEPSGKRYRYEIDFPTTGSKKAAWVKPAKVKVTASCHDANGEITEAGAEWKKLLP